MEPSPFWKLFCWTTFIEEFCEVRTTIVSSDSYYFFYIIIFFRQAIYIISFAAFILFNIILAHANEEAKKARGEE